MTCSRSKSLSGHQHFIAIHHHRFGKYLIAVTDERVDVDVADLDGPEPATTTGKS
jgi:hypothetical protein